MQCLFQPNDQNLCLNPSEVISNLDCATHFYTLSYKVNNYWRSNLKLNYQVQVGWGYWPFELLKVNPNYMSLSLFTFALVFKY
jgi:hypothetical protein